MFNTEYSIEFLLQHQLVCGAKAKSTGKACQIKTIYSNGRCKYHGGLSTGPRSTLGKKRAAQNGFKKGWRQKAKILTED